MRFPPSLLDDIRARLPVSQVVARKVALKRAGRELKGLSPFKQERTPSFFVNDHKGSWFDFSSGQNGDIFKFVMLTEGLSFPEAVERLAEEAGLAIPKPSPREAEQEDERARLQALLEAAARFFAEQLGAARRLRGAPLPRQARPHAGAIARFRLGYAPNDRSALREHLAKAGFSTAEMAVSGMLVTGDDIPVGYDRFRHRIIFPICDLKGRVIAFGGRALDPDAPAKYLNSPETPLFHKGANLYNFHNARGPAHDKAQVIAVEGYMDAIALCEAGFPHTVAPLGTALTEDQVRLLWRMAPEPVLCFDGDAAGRRAAFRAVETVLPHLETRLQRAVCLPARRPRPRRPRPPARPGRVPGDARQQALAAVRRAHAARGAAAARGIDARSSAPPSTPACRPWWPASPTAACARTTSASCARPCGPRTARSCARSPARMVAAPRKFAGKRRDNTDARLAGRRAGDRAHAPGRPAAGRNAWPGSRAQQRACRAQPAAARPRGAC